MEFKKILVFDLETTGLDFVNDNIIEFGGVLIQKDENNYYRQVETVDYLIKQDKKLPDFIKELTHITDEMLEDIGITEFEAFDKISSLIDKDTLLVGYNVHFDFSFLRNLFKRYNGSNYELSNSLIDMMAVYRDFNNYPNRLKDAIEKYGITTPNSHRASDDSLATWELMTKMPKELEKENINLKYGAYINKIGYLPKYPISENQKISYCEYICQKPNSRAIYKLKKDSI